MKKHLLFLSIIFLTFYDVQSQVKVGDYIFIQDSIAYTPLGLNANIIDSSTSSTRIDDLVYNLSSGVIPFHFKFGNDSFRNCYVSTNGFLSFGQTSPGTTNYNPLSSTTAYYGAISAIGADLLAVSDSNTRGRILWDTIGSFPNRVFIVEWRDFARYTTSTTNYYLWSFQIQLHENGNKIAIVYSDFNRMVGTPVSNTTCQVGLRGPSNNFDTLDINNRQLLNTLNASWKSTDMGVANNSSCYMQLSPAILPSQGLRFNYQRSECLSPDSVRFSSVTSNSASLAFRNRGGANKWLIEYDTAFFFPGTGRRTIINDTNLRISGLNPSTKYFLYIRTICGAGDSGAYRGIYEFTTQCLPVNTLPWSEGMENIGRTGNGVLPSCWSFSGTRVFSDTLVNTNNRGARNGKGYAYISWSANDWIFTPQFRLLKNKIYEFSFYYKTDTVANWDSLYTMVGQGPSPSNMQFLIGSPITAFRQGNYTKYVAYFTPNDTGFYNFGIKVRSNSAPWYISFDDFALDTVNNCVNPQSLAADSVKNNSVFLKWQEAGLAKSWQVEIGLKNSGLGNGSRYLSNNKSLKIDSLIGSTEYSFYVRSICGINDTSSWSGPYSFTTLCDPITSLPWVEGFENVTGNGTGFIPSCWFQQGNWGVYDITTTTNNRSPRSGNKYLTGRWSANDRIYTKGMVLQKDKLYNLEFYYKTDGLSGWDSLTVFLANNQNPNSIIQSIGQSLTGITNQNYTLFKESFSVSSDGIYYIGMHLKSTSTPWYISLDDFKLDTSANYDISLKSFITQQYGCGEDSTPLYLVIENKGLKKSSGFNLTSIINASNFTDTLRKNYTDSIGIAQLDTIYMGSYNSKNGGLFNILSFATFSNDGNKLNDSLAFSSIRGKVPSNPLSTIDSICAGSNYTWRKTGNAKQYKILNNNDSLLQTVDSLFSSFPSGNTRYKILAVESSKDSISSNPGTSSSFLGNNGLVFSVSNQPIVIESVEMFYSATSNGFIEISIQDISGSTVASYRDTVLSSTNSYNNTSTPTLVNVNFTLNPSNYYRMVLSAYSGINNIQRDLSASFPRQSQIPNNVSINSGYLNGNSTNYYYFYNWKLKSQECVSDTAIANVTVIPKPVAQITTDTVCIGDLTSIKDMSTNQNIVQFEFDNKLDNTIDLTWYSKDTSFLFDKTGNNTFKITSKNSFGCSNTQFYSAFVRSLPNVQINAPNICLGDSSIAIASGANSYLWNGGKIGNRIAVLPNSDYTYIVRGTDIFGCKNSDTALVKVFELPNLNLGNDTFICENIPFAISLNATNSNSSYLWSTSQTSNSILVSNFGTYSVLVTNSNGCSNSDSITIHKFIAPVVDLGNDTAYCSNNVFTLELNAENPNSNYLWQDSSTLSKYVVTKAGNYFVSVTNNDLCSDTDTLIVLEYAAPSINLGLDTSYCKGDSFVLELDAKNPGAKYTWNDNSDTRTFIVRNAGTYSVQIEDIWSCINSDTIIVTENPLPFVTLGNDIWTNPDLPIDITLNANTNAIEFLWNNNSNESTLKVSDTGEYYIWVTDVNGCTNSDTISIRYWNTLLHTPSIELEKINIYPIPANETINVQLKTPTNFTLKLMDVNGKLIQKVEVVNKNVASLNTQDIPNGNYILAIESNGSIVNQKVSIIHP